MFLQNTSSSNPATMNSQEIADLVKSRHDKVKQSIERLSTPNKVRDAVIALPPMGVVVSTFNNRTYQTEVYTFSGEKGKRDSLIVVAQLCPEFTATIVDRWIELEQQAARARLPDFTNPVAAARAWADEFEAKQVALAQLEQAKPKIQHYDTVVERDTLLNATTVAHSVGLKSAQALNKQLERLGVYNAACKRGRAFRAWFIEQGLGAMKQGATGHHQTLFTTKGQAWVIEKLKGGE